MATKAQQARALQERSGPKRAPKPRKVKPNAVDTSRPGTSVSSRRARGAANGTENESKHGAKRALVVLEESASGKRSRKSTRGSAHGGKPSAQLERAQRQKLSNPAARHSRRG